MFEFSHNFLGGSVESRKTEVSLDGISGTLVDLGISGILPLSRKEEDSEGGIKVAMPQATATLSRDKHVTLQIWIYIYINIFFL